MRGNFIVYSITETPSAGGSGGTLFKHGAPGGPDFFPVAGYVPPHSQHGLPRPAGAGHNNSAMVSGAVPTYGLNLAFPAPAESCAERARTTRARVYPFWTVDKLARLCLLSFLTRTLQIPKTPWSPHSNDLRENN